LFLVGFETQVEMLSTLVAIVGCLIAAITDLKWGIVPDKLNMP